MKLTYLPNHSPVSNMTKGLLMMVASAALAATAHAANTTYVWQGNTSGTLGDPTNWTTGVAPAASGDAAQFGAAGTAGTSLTLASSLNLGYSGTGVIGLEFTSAAPAYTFNGTGYTLTLSTNAMQNKSGNVQTFNTGVRFNTGSGYVLTNANSGFAFNGPLTISSNTTFNMGATTGHSIAFNGDFIGAGGFPLIFAGSTQLSTVTIGGTSNVGLNNEVRIGQNVRLNFSTAATMASGTVTMNSAGATVANTLGSPISSNASLVFASTSASGTFGDVAHTSANSLTFNGTASYNADLTRTITLNGTGLSVNSAGTWNNSVTGNRTLTVNGTGNTFSLGGLSLGATGETGNITYTIQGSANVAVNGNVSIGAGTGTRLLQLNTTGTFTQGGVSTFAGNVAVGASATALVSGTHSGGAGYAVAGRLGGTGVIDLSAQTSSISFVFNSGSYGGKLIASSVDGLTIIGSGTSTVLNLTNAVAPTSNPSLLFTLGAPGTTVVDVQGGLNLGTGTMNFNDFTFTTGPGFAPGTYTLFDYTTVTGSLGSSLTGLVGGFDATISQDNGAGSIVMLVVPEPSTVALGLVAALGCTVTRRRRKN